ncbi:MAG: glycosyltransferase [Candidatus Aminicenantes bacterium]|nr:glycosyltransferase [Candidatus Aminicenantes bacterium]
MKTLIYAPEFPPLGRSGGNQAAYAAARYLWEQNPHELFVFSAGPAWYLPQYELIPQVKRFPIDFDRAFGQNILFQLFDSAFEDVFMEAFYKIKPDVFIFQDLFNIPAHIIARIKKETDIPIAIVLHNLYPFCQKLHLFRYPPCEVGLCNGLHDSRECLCCLSDNYYRGLKLHDVEEKELLRFSQQRRRYLSCIYRMADRLIAPSQFIKDIYEKALEKPVHLVRNGVLPLPLPLSAPGDKKRALHSPPVFAFMGQADLAKGIFVALKAFSACTNNKAKFLVYGEISPQTPLPPVSILKSSLNNIEFRGPYKQEDLPRIYQEIDVAVLPSYFENYPTAILEAFHYHTPVIACRTGGVPELVTHDTNGLLFAPGNWQELLRHIETLSANREAISRLQKNILPPRDYREMGRELEEIIAGISLDKSIHQSLRQLDDLEKELKSAAFLPKRNFYALSRDFKQDKLSDPAALVKMQRRPYSPMDLLIERHMKNTSLTNLLLRKKQNPATAGDYFAWAAYFLESGDPSTALKMFHRLRQYGPFFPQYPRVLIFLGEQARGKNGDRLIKEGMALLAAKDSPDLNDLLVLFEKNLDMGQQDEARQWLEKLQRYESNYPDYWIGACFRFADHLRFHDQPNWETWINKGIQTLSALEVSGPLTLSRVIQAEYCESLLGHAEESAAWGKRSEETAPWLETSNCEKLCREFADFGSPQTPDVAGEIPGDPQLRSMALFLFKHSEHVAGPEGNRMRLQGAACLSLVRKKATLDYYWAASLLKRNGQLDQALKLFNRVSQRTNTADSKIRAGAYYHKAEIYCNRLNLRQARDCLGNCLGCEPRHKKARELLHRIERGSRT